MLISERIVVLLGLVTNEGLQLNPTGDDLVDLAQNDRLFVLGRFDLLSSEAAAG